MDSRSPPDPYAVLNLSPAADAPAIRSAFRRLAKSCHPDLNPGDRDAAIRFQTLKTAYDLLSNPALRERYDQGLIDGEGAPRPFGGNNRHRGPRAARYDRGPAPANDSEPFHEPFMDDLYDDPSMNAVWEDFSGPETPSSTWSAADPDTADQPPSTDNDEDLTDLFREIFREGGQGTQSRPSGPASGLRGRDMRYTLTVDFREAALGARKKLALTSGRDVEVVIPPASEHGQVLRLAGLGLAGAMGAAAGDALVELSVIPHPTFQRAGLDLLATVAIGLEQALLGGRVSIDGLDGPLYLDLPSPTQPGQQLFYPGQGLRAGEFQGDLKITAQVILPDPVDQTLKDFCLAHQRARERGLL